MISVNSLCVAVLLIVGHCNASGEVQQKSNNATRQARVNHLQQTNNQGFCVGNNDVGGVCMTRLACTRGGGTQLGVVTACGPYHICCDVPSTCNSNTPLRSKYTSIKNPAQIADRCTFTIQPYSVNVCQLRFDFVNLALANPATAAEATAQNIPVGSCQNQILDFNGMLLCGDLSGQHLYVPIDQTNGNLGSEFSFQILTQTINAGTTSNWNIQVTQLECTPTNAPMRNGFLTIPRQSTIQELRRMFTPRSRDESLLAPPGCDQYYTAPRGKITSFNYQNGLGQYPQNLHINICVKRGNGDNNLDLSAAAGRFELGFDAEIPAGELPIDQFCHRSIATPGINNDYLMVPPTSVFSANALLDAVFFCGTSLAGQKVVTEGPFILIFNSDGTTTAREPGFDLDYNVY